MCSSSSPTFDGNTHVVIKLVTNPVLHSECPHWDETKETLLFCDTFNATVYRWKYGDAKDKLAEHRIANKKSVGIIVPIRGGDGYVVCADRSMFRLHWSGAGDSATLSERLAIEDDRPKNQFNDGKADARGRLWVGTLERNEDLSVAPNGGSLYCFESGRATERLSRLSISNGLAWSRDNKRFYFIDSMTKKVRVYDYDLNSGFISNERDLFEMEQGKYKGIPDGMTIDTNDNLWVALFGDRGIIQVCGRTGRMLRRIKMPVTYVTSVAFGGPNLDVLFATTSKLHLDEEGRRREPNAGAVFSIEGLGVRGLPANTAVFD